MEEGDMYTKDHWEWCWRESDDDSAEDHENDAHARDVQVSRYSADIGKGESNYEG